MADRFEPDVDEYECEHCDGKGWGFDFKGGKIVCDACNGTGDPTDDDPQCVCGVYRSEHRMMGCGEGLQTKGSWAVEREFIVSLDSDDYERIYGGY